MQFHDPYIYSLFINNLEQKMVFSHFIFKKIILNFYKKIIFLLKKKIDLDLERLDSLSLNELFNHFGTDKGTEVKNPYSKNIDTHDALMGHGYAEFYEFHFNHIKNKEIKLLEIGTWKGVSVLVQFVGLIKQ